MKQLVSLFVAGLMAVLALYPQASAENRQVNADSLYVRTNPGGFFIGTLYTDAGFFRQETSGNGLWGYGYAGGNFQGCGWVQLSFTRTGGSTPAGCAGGGFQGTGVASRQFLLDYYARQVNDYIPGSSLPLANGGTSVRVKPGVIAGVYGNYRGGSHQNHYGNIDSNYSLSWRWVSDDGRSVAVNVFPGSPNAFWAFIRRDKLPDTLPYSDGVRR